MKRLKGFDYTKPYFYPVLNRQPTRSELYRRCHEMGDIVVAGLP